MVLLPNRGDGMVKVQMVSLGGLHRGYVIRLSVEDSRTLWMPWRMSITACVGITSRVALSKRRENAWMSVGGSMSETRVF